MNKNNIILSDLLPHPDEVVKELDFDLLEVQVLGYNSKELISRSLLYFLRELLPDLNLSLYGSIISNDEENISNFGYFVSDIEIVDDIYTFKINAVHSDLFLIVDNFNELVMTNWLAKYIVSSFEGEPFEGDKLFLNNFKHEELEKMINLCSSFLIRKI